MDRPGFSEETILSVSKTTLNNARNHLKAFNEFGISEGTLHQFEKDIQTAEALPREAFNRIELKSRTQIKNEVKDACLVWAKKLQTRIELAFGKKSPEANSFPTSDFRAAQSSEKATMNMMETLTKVSDKYQIQLAPHGQTPEVLAQGLELLNQLRSADTAQEIKKEERTTSTKERNEKFLLLYETVNKINKVGRLVFKDDPIKRALFESKWPTQSTGKKTEAEAK
jgi:hypothetical protein